MNKIKHQNEHFESISEKYYTARQNKKHLLYKRLLFNYMLSDVSNIVENKRIAVLEPMCGYGEGRDIVRKFITRNIDYEGFDYNDTLIKKVKEKYPSMKIYKQNIITFHTEKKYDIVILIGGLHHVPDYAGNIVDNISSVLNPGGWFINFEPTQNNPIIALARAIIYRKNDFFDNETEHDFSLDELNQIYSKAGFTIFRQFYPGLLGYILYYNPDAFPLLNIGNRNLVKKVFDFEKKLYSSKIGCRLSFATFSILRI